MSSLLATLKSAARRAFTVVKRILKDFWPKALNALANREQGKPNNEPSVQMFLMAITALEKRYGFRITAASQPTALMPRLAS